ncbi:LysR substrate-binding domain-containing protein, partial [Streptomyces cacaoi]|uniref:LysR substrate-binding domain-containing protein n=1 Tax=Streptomyces cacaoi TaxID=1898 RepID=UPI00374A883D
EDAIELVAANIGVLVVPQSLARLHHRKDLTYRTIVDAPRSDIALAWPEDATTELVEDFIGIVRGRTVNSTRGRAQQAPAPERKGERRKPQAGGGAGKSTAGGARGRSGGAKGGAAKGGGGRRGTGGGKPRRRS